MMHYNTRWYDDLITFVDKRKRIREKNKKLSKGESCEDSTSTITINDQKCDERDCIVLGLDTLGQPCRAKPPQLEWICDSKLSQRPLGVRAYEFIARTS